MSTILTSAWIIGFIIKSESLPTGATRLTMDNGQIGIVENHTNTNFPFSLEPSQQEGFTNRGVAFKKNQQNIVTEIRRARVRVGITVMEQTGPSLVYQFYHTYKKVKIDQKFLNQPFLDIMVIPTPTPFELLPWLPNFSNFKHISEDAAKNKKPVDLVIGEHPSEVLYIQYSQSAHKNPPGSFQAQELNDP
jgi:hypothetical protein